MNVGKSDELQIGARLKHARLLEGILIRELAERVSCTESMISKIENSKAAPSLDMLQRLVRALNRDLSSFLDVDITAAALVQRAGERPISTPDAFHHVPTVRFERLVPLVAGNLLDGHIKWIEPGPVEVERTTHPGETLGYVIEGELELTIQTSIYQLKAGDSFYFRNHMTNRYRNIGGVVARVLWVSTPPK